MNKYCYKVMKVKASKDIKKGHPAIELTKVVYDVNNPMMAIKKVFGENITLKRINTVQVDINEFGTSNETFVVQTYKNVNGVWCRSCVSVYVEI